MMEWAFSYKKKENHLDALRLSNFLNGRFPYKSQYEWYCILTQIKYIKELIE